MPVPSSDAISSDIGHGAFGARTGLRTFAEFLGETSGQRHVWVEFRPGWVPTEAWSDNGDGTFTLTPATWPTFDGVTLAPVQIEYAGGICVQAAAVSELAEGLFTWDGSSIRAQFAGSDGSDGVAGNPNSTTTVIRLGFYVGTASVVHGQTSYERLSNPGFEDWTGAVPDDWTLSGSDFTLGETADNPYAGSAAARFTLAAAASADFRTVYQDEPNASAVWFEVSGYYRGDITGGSAEFSLWVYEAVALNSMDPDGRHWSAGLTPVLTVDADTGGQWRHFAFYYRVPWSTANATRHEFQIEATAAGTSGTVDLDGMSVRQLTRWALHLPLLSLSGVPHIEASRADAFYGPTSTGIGALTLANGGGYLEPLFADYDWLQADCIIRAGGRYTADGNDIPLSDCPIFARARVSRPMLEDGRAVLTLEDQRSILQEYLPQNVYNKETFPNLANEDAGRPRPVGFGVLRNVKPVRYGLQGNGAGQYELGDGSYTFVGTSGNAGTLSYVDEEAAWKEDTSARVLLDPNDIIQISLPDIRGRMVVLRDVRPRLITEENRAVDFDIGGSALVARLPIGIYKPGDRLSGVDTTPSIAEDLEDAMNAAAGVSDIGVNLGGTTDHLFQISKGAGTLNLLCSTGANRDSSLWSELGFSVDADRTGALSYESDNAIFTDPSEHVLRMPDAQGAFDDVDGSYTGLSSVPPSVYFSIDLRPDICQFLLRAVLGVKDEEIDLVSFVNGRVVGSGSSNLYIEEPVPFAKVLEWIETSDGADVVIDRGLWTWVKRDAATPGNVVDLFDHDYLSFAAGYDAEDLQGQVILAYDREASTRRWRTLSTESESLGPRYARSRPYVFETCLQVESKAVARLSGVAAEAHSLRRRFSFSVPGKALLTPVGGKLRLTRSLGLDSAGALSNVLVRILSKRDDLLRWQSDIEAIEVRQLWALGVAGLSELGETTILAG